MQIYEKLRVLRLCKGWSQDEMAEKIGYSLNGYAKIERGETELKVDKLEKIAEIVGINLQQLLGMNEKNIFNIIENFTQAPQSTNTQSVNIYLTETQCAHELEKAQLLLQEREKEVGYLKEENARLKEMLALLKERK
jgi:transcriptional regulator with XRE-family HTH domain